MYTATALLFQVLRERQAVQHLILPLFSLRPHSCPADGLCVQRRVDISKLSGVGISHDFERFKKQAAHVSALAARVAAWAAPVF